jgi:hypothetical protein
MKVFHSDGCAMRGRCGVMLRATSRRVPFDAERAKRSGRKVEVARILYDGTVIEAIATRIEMLVVN